MTFLNATLLLCSGLPVLGGSDDCATPTPISGTGTFLFDLTGATPGLEGQNEPLCLSYGTMAIDDDEWYAWTASADGCAEVTTCFPGLLDTRIAAYPGSGCPVDGTALACSDDECSTASTIEFEVVAGSTYTLQIGTFPGTSGAPGNFDIFLVQCPGPVKNLANGHYYELIEETVSWTDAKANAESQSLMGISGHLVTISDITEDIFVYYTLTGSNLGNAWLGAQQDMNAPDYMEPGGGWGWVTGEPFTYTNWTAGEPNDGGGNEHYLGYYPADQWNDYVATDGTVQRYVIEYETDTGIDYCFGDGSASTCPCGNFGATGEGCANSTGSGGALGALGLPTLVPDELMFRASNLIPGQPALLFVGLNATNGGMGLLLGDGLRCAGGSVVRLGTANVDSSGEVGWGPGLAAQGGWGPGDLRRFQVWYRDPIGSACGAGFNTTNGTEIQFLP